jgi:ubiquinone/menaquinone biosynthesis C-methylase UbiE
MNERHEESFWDTTVSGNVHGIPPYSLIDVSQQFIGMSGRILDLGCGDGRFTRFLADILDDDTMIHGVDISSVLLKTAATDAPANTRWWHGDGRHLPPGLTGEFDAAYAITVFQHIPIDAVWGYLRGIHTRLRPGGKFAFTIAVGERQEFLDHQIADPEDFALDLAGLYSSVSLAPFPDENGWTWVEAWK